MTIRDVLASVTRKERLLVAGVAAVVMAVTAIPPIVGLAVARSSGLHWSGLQFLAPGDFVVYMSYITQARDGAFLLDNMFTTQPTVPVLNVLWGSVGLIARVLGTGPLFAFHAARTLLIPAFAAVSYASIAVFLRDRRERAAAFLVLMFGSGLGLYFAPLFAVSKPAGGTYEWPTDMWVGESNAFMSMLYSPHFVASFTLIIASAALLYLAFRNRSYRYAAAAGILALLLFEFHPFHAPTLYAAFGAYLALETVRSRATFRMWAQFAAFVALSAPAVAYHFAVAQDSAFARELVEANLTVTPSFIQVVIGFGMIGILGAAGAARAFRGRPDEPRRFLAVWAAVNVVLLYAPFTFQRRLIEGLEFPLAVLGASALAAAASILIERRTVLGLRAPAVVTMAAIVLFLPSSFSAVARNVDGYRTNRPPVFYYTGEQLELVRWIRGSTPQDATFLSFLNTGAVVGGWAGRKVYFGHWVNSGHPEAKMKEVKDFFLHMTPSERRAFMGAHGLTHVIVGPEERLFGGLKNRSGFRHEATIGEFDVYSLEPDLP